MSEQLDVRSLDRSEDATIGKSEGVNPKIFIKIHRTAVGWLVLAYVSGTKMFSLFRCRRDSRSSLWAATLRLF